MIRILKAFYNAGVFFFKKFRTAIKILEDFHNKKYDINPQVLKLYKMYNDAKVLRAQSKILLEATRLARQRQEERHRIELLELEDANMLLNSEIRDLHNILADLKKEMELLKFGNNLKEGYDVNKPSLLEKLEKEL